MRRWWLVAWLAVVPCRGADRALLFLEGGERVELDAQATDLVRENLIHLFDSAMFHQLEGGALPVTPRRELERQLEALGDGAYFELTLDKPARIVVEGVELRPKRMWARVRTTDGFVSNWMFEEPGGRLVGLAKARGELVVLFAPKVLQLLRLEDD